jgi:hypothetical protein
MSNGLRVLYKSLLTYVIDFFLFLIVLISVAYFDEYLKLVKFQNHNIIKYILFGLFVVYLVLSNTYYRGLSSLILKYKFTTGKIRTLKLVVSNIIFYSLLCAFIWLSVEKPSSILLICIEILLGVELGSCLIPKINTRLTLYLFQLKIEFYVRKKRVLENDGILL